MNARNILNSNLLSKNTIVESFFEKNGFQNFLPRFFQKKKFMNANFSKKNYTTPKDKSSNDFKHRK